MILIFGGAYQGKTNFVKEKYNINDEDIYSIEKFEIDKKNNTISLDNITNNDYKNIIEEERKRIILSKKCINHLENFTYNCIITNINPYEEFKKIEKYLFEDYIIISLDSSLGIVPIDALDRKIREEHSLLMQYIAKKAYEVIRVFLSIPQKIK
ncbi:MAG: cobalamin biosynthesis protein CobU [Eubacteriales bacterium]|nr:cobalamin biosynthesis protein CobU [Eubacteriales bacterium]